MIPFLLIMFLMAGWQIPRMVQKNEYREIIYFIIIWLSAVIYGSVVISDITLVSPFELINDQMVKLFP